MSQSSYHLKLVSWTWQWVHCTPMASTVTRSQSNRAALGCGGTGVTHHRCAADKSAATIMSIWTKISEECFQHLVESMPRRIKAVLKAKGVQPFTSKVYLIMWPGSVCCVLQSMLPRSGQKKEESVSTRIYILALVWWLARRDRLEFSFTDSDFKRLQVQDQSVAIFTLSRWHGWTLS